MMADETLTGIAVMLATAALVMALGFKGFI